MEQQRRIDVYRLETLVMEHTTESKALREVVRTRYAAVASAVTHANPTSLDGALPALQTGGCCGSASSSESCCDPATSSVITQDLYATDELVVYRQVRDTIRQRIERGITLRVPPDTQASASRCGFRLLVASDERWTRVWTGSAARDSGEEA